MLERHILNLNLQEFTILLAEGKYLVGGLCVDMDLDDASVLECDKTVTDSLEVILDDVHIEVLDICLGPLETDKDFSAITEFKYTVFVEER